MICIDIFDIDDNYFQAIWNTLDIEFPTVDECVDHVAAYCGYPF